MSRKIANIADLAPDARNANKGTQRGRGMVEASLREVGAGRSIVVDKEGRVIAGNKTLEAAADIGLEIQVVHSDGQKLFVVQRDDLDLSDDTGAARKLAYLDNQSSNVGLAWDAEVMLADLNAGVDLSGIFNQNELDALLADLMPPDPITDPGPQVDKADELRQKWGVELGQMWQLGDHRLICGDCTDKATVERLMGGKKADMVFTDPPYNIDYGNIKHPKFKVRQIENDSMSNSDWLTFCDLIADTIEVMTDGCVYVCHAPGPDGRVIATVMDNRFHCSTTIIWNKDVFTLGRGKYQNKYEPIWFGWVKKGTGFTEARNLSNVWDVTRPKSSEEHPTMKPVELVELAISHASNSGGIVGEPFSGSGTTIIACEQLGRKCRAVEISPAYVAVALQRWADATGRTPELTN